MNDIPIQNNLDLDDEVDQYNTHDVPTSNIIHESKRNLFKVTPGNILFLEISYYIL